MRSHKNFGRIRSVVWTITGNNQTSKAEYINRLKRILNLSEFNEFEPQLKSAKTRFQFSAGLTLEKLNTILSRTNHI